MKDYLNNYCLVTNVLFMGKLIKRLVADQLQAFLGDTDTLDPFQTGFRPCHVTETALVELLDDVLQEVN